MAAANEEVLEIKLDEEPASRRQLTGRSIGVGAGFITHFVFGALGLVAGALLSPLTNVVGWLVGVVVPLLSMTNFYRVRIHNRDYDARSVDALYYLGFCFTLTALLVAFTVRGVLGDDISSDETLGTFGSALISTVVGLVVRTGVEYSHEDAEISSASVETGLRDLAAATMDEMENILSEFHDRSSKMNKAYADQAEEYYAAVTTSVRESIGEYGGVLDNSSEELAAAVRGASEAALMISERFASLSEPIAALSTIVEKAGSSVDVAARQYAEAFETAANELEGAFSAASSSVVDASQKYHDAADQLNQAVRHSKTTLDSVGKLAETSKVLGDEIAALSTDLNELSQSVRDASKNSGEASSHFARELEQSVEKIRETTEPVAKSLQGIVGQFSNSVDVLKKTLGSQDER